MPAKRHSSIVNATVHLQSDVYEDEVEELLSFLQLSHPSFYMFDARDIALLAESFSVTKFTAGQKVVQQGESATWFGIVLRGSLVDVSTETSQETVPAGTIIGELAVVEKHHARQVTLEGREDGLMASLLTYELPTFVAECPETELSNVLVPRRATVASDGACASDAAQSIANVSSSEMPSTQHLILTSANLPINRPYMTLPKDDSLATKGLLQMRTAQRTATNHRLPCIETWLRLRGAGVKLLHMVAEAAIRSKLETRRRLRVAAMPNSVNWIPPESENQNDERSVEDLSLLKGVLNDSGFLESELAVFAAVVAGQLVSAYRLFGVGRERDAGARARAALAAPRAGDGGRAAARAVQHRGLCRNAGSLIARTQHTLFTSTTIKHVLITYPLHVEFKLCNVNMSIGQL
eukprot:4238734-Pleurochrysis_carterae.AAC.6